MGFIWNASLNKAAVLQEKYGSRDIRFFGVTIGWIGFGFLVGVKKQVK